MNLERADLRGAHLENADLHGAHLEGAGLFGAHLEGAVLVEAQIAEAYGDITTQLPKGMARPKHWLAAPVDSYPEPLGSAVKESHDGRFLKFGRGGR